MNWLTSIPSSQTSQPSPQAPRVGLSQSSSTKRMSWRRRIDAERREAAEIEILAVGRRRLQDDLKLVIMLQPVRVFAIAAVGRAARWLDIGGAPRFRPERAQGGRRVERAGADFDIVGLQDHAALLRPKTLQIQNQGLKARPAAQLLSHNCSSRDLPDGSTRLRAGRPAAIARAGRNIGPAYAAGNQSSIASRPRRRRGRARGAGAPRGGAAIHPARNVPDGQRSRDQQNELRDRDRHHGASKAKDTSKTSSVVSGYRPKRAHNARASTQSSNSATDAAIAPSDAIAGRSRGSHQRRRR